MKELVEVIAKALVDCPDEVVVTETAIRSVVKAAASKEEKKVIVEIMQ